MVVDSEREANLYNEGEEGSEESEKKILETQREEIRAPMNIRGRLYRYTGHRLDLKTGGKGITSKKVEIGLNEVQHDDERKGKYGVWKSVSKKKELDWGIERTAFIKKIPSFSKVLEQGVLFRIKFVSPPLQD